MNMNQKFLDFSVIHKADVKVYCRQTDMSWLDLLLLVDLNLLYSPWSQILECSGTFDDFR